MNNEVLGNILKNLPSSKDKLLFLEAMSVLTDDLGRRIIEKAASPHSPVAVNEFSDIPQTKMIRYLRLLASLNILKPEWEKGVKKFAITALGRNMAELFKNP